MTAPVDIKPHEKYSSYYYEKNWSASQVRLKRHWSKKRDLPFDLTKEDIPIPDVCPVLGIPLKVNPGHHNKDDSPSVDRIDPTKGYVKGNVAVISCKANRIKNDATLEELEKVCEWLSKVFRR